jgi:putative phosphoribosyl transferase
MACATAGASAIDIKRGLDRGLRIAVDTIRSLSRPITTRNEKIQTATISAHNDASIGTLIGDAIEKVGGEGVITVEEAKGTVAEGGEVFVDAHIVREVGASEAEVQEVIARKTAEVEERCKRFRGGRAAPDLADKTVLLVDDGIATGGTARAALRAIRRRGPRRVVLAVPVASTDTLEALAPEADEIVCLSPQPELYAIGPWYENFRPVEDDDVVAILDKAQGRAEALTEEPLEHSVRIPTREAELEGDLTVPAGSKGIVLFAHGSGSSRKSPATGLSRVSCSVRGSRPCCSTC